MNKFENSYRLDSMTIEQIDALLEEMDKKTQEALDQGETTIVGFNRQHAWPDTRFYSIGEDHACGNSDCTIVHRGHRTIGHLTRIIHAKAEKAKAKLS